MPREVNQTDLASITGYSTRQIRNLEAEGLPHRAEGNQKLYPLPDAIDWIRERDREAVRSDLEETSYSQARARKEAAKARLAELELAQEEGRLMPREVVDDIYGGALDRVRRGILNMPGRWAQEWAAAESPREAEAVLRRVATELLEGLSSLADAVERGTGELPDDFPGIDALRSAEIETFTDLLRVQDLQEIRGIGPKTEEKIIQALDEWGFDAAA